MAGFISQAVAGVAQPFTIYLDHTSHATVSAANVYNAAGSTCASPSLSIATAGTVSAYASEYQTLNIASPAGQLFKLVDFASYGNPNVDANGNFVIGNCIVPGYEYLVSDAANSRSVVEAALLGNASASIFVGYSTFMTDPCGAVKALAVTATYADAPFANQITFTAAGTYSVLLAAAGCGSTTYARTTVTVLPAPRCGTNMTQYTVCHKGRTMCVDASGVSDHLAHGDYMGSCSGAARSEAAEVANASATAPQLELASLPNPTTDGQFQVQLQAAEAGQVQVSLFDMQGTLISTLFTGTMTANEQRNISVNRPDLRRGLYLVRVQNGQKSRSMRIEVQK